MKSLPKLFGPLAMILFIVMLLAGCGGGASSDGAGTASAQDGELAISLTDAPGDFAGYTVDVVSLTLTKANGTIVSTMPLSTRVDFSQYTEMTEFLTIGTVPLGAYVAATMTLDYRNADIHVEDESGNIVPVDTILDTDGNPVTTLEVTVQLENRNKLVVAPGLAAHLLLDFNLQATNQVAFDNIGVPTLTVDPFLVAEVNRTGPKMHRLRGLLNEVDVNGGSFSVFLRPFFHALTGQHRQFGMRTVLTDDATVFEVDGSRYVGVDGLVAMEGLDPLAAVVAVGELRFNPLRFEADQVYAGTSVPGGDQDAVKGSVIARAGNTLTIKGATLIRSDSSIVFCDLVTVEVGAGTVVTRQLSAETFSIDDISVGQRILVFGVLTDTDPLSLAMNADPGTAHMLITTLRGEITAIGESDPVARLNMDLRAIDQRPVEIFDFSGTGIDPANDADPADYQVDTGGIDLSPFGVAEPVRVRGFVQPFGQAPADFNALTVIGRGEVRTFMRVNWVPPSAEAFQSISADGLVLDLTGVGRFHHLIQDWLVTDLATLGQPVTLAPPADGNGLYVLRFRGITQVLLSFDDFSSALQRYLDDGAAVRALGATGDFDDATATLAAGRIEVRLK